MERFSLSCRDAASQIGKKIRGCPYKSTPCLSVVCFYFPFAGAASVFRLASSEMSSATSEVQPV